MAINKSTKYTTNPNTIPVDTGTGAGEQLDSSLNKRAVWTSYVTEMSSDIDTSLISDGQTLIANSHNPNTDTGGGLFRFDATAPKSSHDGGIIISPTVPWQSDISLYLSATGETDPSGQGCFVRVVEGDYHASWWGPKTDFTDAAGTKAALQAAIDSLPGIKDLTSAYEYVDSPKLRIEAGKYLVDSRLFANKNNVRIIGDGSFNTVIKCANTVQITEIIRFEASYGSELSHIEINGGLPFTPDLTETYGADVALTLDQCASFYSEDLNLTNYRYEGKRCIHLWESYFSNLRIFNGGFFGGGANPSAGIRYTTVGKNETFFAGGESNNITYDKLAFGTVGAWVKCDEVPSYNLFFSGLIAEGRTWSTEYGSLGEVKFRVGGTSANVVIESGYAYPHEQPFVANATMFDYTNCGPGCRVDSFRIYTENNLAGHQNEVRQILNVDSSHVLDFNVNVEQIGNTPLNYLINATSISTVRGQISYRADDNTIVKDDLFNGESSETRFIGKLFFFVGALGSDLGVNYEYDTRTRERTTVGTNIVPSLKCVAILNVDPTTSTVRRSANIASFVKNSTGQYTITFEKPFPDAFYVANISANVLNDPNEKVEIGVQSTTQITIANRAGATYYDPSVLNLAIFID